MSTVVKVRWHPYDGFPARTEWLDLPREHMSIYETANFISKTLREREGLPPDTHQPGERILWFEWEYVPF